MTTTHTRLIKENVAPEGAAAIGVVDSDGQVIGYFPLGTLAHNYGQKLYSFGVMNDIHIGYSGAEANLPVALKFMSTYGCRFIVANGDICVDNTNIESALSTYGNYLSNGKYENIPVYTTAGNHENAGGNNISAYKTQWQAATGMSNFYFKVDITAGSETHHIICLSCINNDGPDVNAGRLSGYFGIADSTKTAQLDWLDSTLTACGNDKVFVFEHICLPDKCNYAFGYNTGRILNNTTTNYVRELDRIRAAIKAHPNAVWFTGHTHQPWNKQGISGTVADRAQTLYDREDVTYIDKGNNYDANIGSPNGSRVNEAWVTHVPSLCPDTAKESDCEFAVVDVYSDCVIFKGVKRGTFLPIAQYKLSFDSTSSGGSTGGDTGGGSTTARSYIDTTNMIIYGYKGETLNLGFTPTQLMRQDWSIFGVESTNSSVTNRVSYTGTNMTFLDVANKNWANYGSTDNYVSGLSTSNDESECWFWTCVGSTKYKTIINTAPNS